jgi:protein kinase-like protein
MARHKLGGIDNPSRIFLNSNIRRTGKTTQSKMSITNKDNVNTDNTVTDTFFSQSKCECDRCIRCSNFRTALDNFVNQSRRLSDKQSDHGLDQSQMMTNTIHHREGVTLTLKGYSIAPIDDEDKPKQLTILYQDYAAGGESSAIDVGIYFTEGDSRICLIKTLCFEAQKFWNTPKTYSNEITIADILQNIPIEDRRNIAMPFLHYDRNEVYENSIIPVMMRCASKTKNEFVSILYDYISGHDLREIIKYHPERVTLEFIKWVIKSTWNGLKALHRNRIIHSDIKAANVMIEDNLSLDDNLYIIDFGKASYLPAFDTSDEFQTEKRKAMKRSFSTPSYISASILIDTDIATIKNQEVYFAHSQLSDIWSFGMLIYELVTGTSYYKYKGMSVVVLSSIMRDMESNLTSGSHIEIDSEIEQGIDPAILNMIYYCCTYRPINVVSCESEYVLYAQDVIEYLNEAIDKL